jgi:hypothetical protein
MTRHNMIAAFVLMAAAPMGVAAQTDEGIGIQPNDRTPPSRQGSRGANFLNLPVGARGIAMAGSVVSSEEGSSAWYWNPAGAAATEGFTAGFTRQALYRDLDISLNYFGISMPALGGVIGAHATSLNSGDIPRTDEANPAGSIQSGTVFDWNAASVGVGYARRLTDRLSLGVTGKYVTEGMNNASISWAALDAGTTFRTGLYGLSIGASLANVGGSSRMKGGLIERNINSDEIAPQIINGTLRTRETDLPTQFRFSLGSDLLGSSESLFGARGGGSHRLIGEAAFSDAIDANIQSAYALEYSWRSRVFLRGGKRFYNDERATGETGMYGLSGGAGVRVPLGQSRSLRFDYAYTSLGDLENVQVFTFELGR